MIYYDDCRKILKEYLEQRGSIEGVKLVMGMLFGVIAQIEEERKEKEEEKKDAPV